MRTALITVVHGRHEHLRRQQQSLARSTRPVDHRVVVAVDDPDVGAVLATAPVPDSEFDLDSELTVVELPSEPEGLPLAAARNTGALAALAQGAELLIFLDVDCLPDPALVGAYLTAAETVADSLLCGPVAYLPPPPADGYDLEHLRDHPPHPARPVPPPGSWQTGGDHRLFWSLSFAVTASTWEVVGGFDERFVGYGAEDTDFAFAAREAGVGLTWVGDAHAFHQWHPTRTPPTQHLDDILRNGALFARRWGRWPMEGWLAEFAAQGLIEPDPGRGWRRPERLSRR